MDTISEPSVNSADERLISRQDLSVRWACGLSTLKRLEQRGVLKPIVLGTRIVRYKLSEIVKKENEREEDRGSTLA